MAHGSLEVVWHLAARQTDEVLLRPLLGPTDLQRSVGRLSRLAVLGAMAEGQLLFSPSSACAAT